ncbi:MAG TPA: DUF1326 domain-containing protein [Bryobacteraceae bacterium]|nr:DUF1326 domain-containing protein [Bryobacteraceae bacterium]
MKNLLLVLCGASALFAAGFPSKQLRGTYVEARSADVFVGPCFANSEVEMAGNLAVMGWKIEKGSWEGVSLDGLGVVGVVKASATLGDVHHTAYPVKSVLIIDEKASPEQRMALKSFAQRMSNDLLSDVVRIDYKPVTLTVEDNNVHTATAKLEAGAIAAIQTRGIRKADQVCSHEGVWYPPLTAVDHAMPAYALAHNYKGDALGTKWSSPEKASAFVANFHLSE